MSSTHVEVYRDGKFITAIPRREWFETRRGWASRERSEITIAKLKHVLKHLKEEELARIRKMLVSEFLETEEVEEVIHQLIARKSSRIKYRKSLSSSR